MSADEAAALIEFGTRIGMSGFTGSGYPKAVPLALARLISDANLRGQKAQVSIFTGASTGPELDGALAKAGGIQLRLPYQSDPETRKRINAGEMEYMDIHLGHVAQYVENGFLGKMDWAIIEVTAILEDGRLVPSSSVGNNRTWIEQAEKVIIEVNARQPAELEACTTSITGCSRRRIASLFRWCIRGKGLAHLIFTFRWKKLRPWCSPILPIATAPSRRRT